MLIVEELQVKVPESETAPVIVKEKSSGAVLVFNVPVAAIVKVAQAALAVRVM
jgi:hypothetical protein